MKVEVPFIEVGLVGGKAENLTGNIRNVVLYLLSLNAK